MALDNVMLSVVCAVLCMRSVANKLIMLSGVMLSLLAPDKDLTVNLRPSLTCLKGLPILFYMKKQILR